MYFHHVEILFQHRTRLEGQHPAGGDGNCLPGLRVPPLSVSLLVDLKLPKAEIFKFSPDSKVSFIISKTSSISKKKVISMLKVIELTYFPVVCKNSLLLL